jgi:hypothetical protein
MADNAGIENIQPTEGFSDQEFRWSYWWVAHRAKVRRIATIVLVCFDVIVMATGGAGVVDWLAISGIREERNIRLIASPAYAQAPQLPAVQEIQVDTPIVFAIAGSRYDFVSTVTNPNPQYWVEMDYQFSIGDQDGPMRRGFVLPGETKRVVELGLKSDASSGVQARLTIVRRAFHHLDRHAVADYDTWSKARLDMPATGAVFIAATAGATVPTSITSFTITNQTPYTFYGVGANVFVWRGDNLVGANRIAIDTFKAGAIRPIQLYWFQDLPGVTRVEVVPDINILDPSVYQNLKNP